MSTLPPPQSTVVKLRPTTPPPCGGGGKGDFHLLQETRLIFNADVGSLSNAMVTASTLLVRINDQHRFCV